MDIAGNKIQLLITEEEADIIMQALQQYEGPYHKDAVLTQTEQWRKLDKIEKADNMAYMIGNELTARYYEQCERNTYKGD